jgi:hypothetical protein
VLKVVFENIHEGVEIIHSHCFNQEISIVGEEEETSTLSHAFSCLKDTLNILIIDWTQTFFDVIQGKAISASELSKNIRSKFLAMDFTIHKSIVNSIFMHNVVISKFPLDLSFNANCFRHILVLELFS